MQEQVTCLAKIYMVMLFWQPLATHGGPKTFFMKKYP